MSFKSYFSVTLCNPFFCLRVFLDVKIPCTGLCETFVTYRARERFYTQMDPHVCPQISQVSEVFITDITFVQLQVRVNCMVKVLAVKLNELFVASFIGVKRK